MSYHITQIDGWQYLTGGWFPRVPTVVRYTYDSITYKTTWQVQKQDFGMALLYINDNYELIEATAISSSGWRMEGSARDATNPFRILFAYNYISDTVIMREGTPAAEPLDPALQANEILIGYETEPAIGGTVVPPVPTPSTNLFGVTEIFSDGSGNLTFEFGTNNPISHNFITLTENITGDLLRIGDLPGKTLVLWVAAGAFSITWDEAQGYYLSDNSADLEATGINIFVITKNPFSTGLNPTFDVDNKTNPFA